MDYLFVRGHSVKIILLSLFMLLGLVCCAQYSDMHSDLTAPNYFLIPNQPQWNALEHKILSSKEKNIVIDWRGGGGLTWMGDQFIDTILEAQKQGKTIELNVTGFTASMHANVVCFVNKVTMQPTAMLYYHGVFIKVFYWKWYLNDSTRAYGQVCAQKGILSQIEVENILINQHKAIEIFKGWDRRYVSDGEI